MDGSIVRWLTLVVGFGAAVSCVGVIVSILVLRIARSVALCHIPKRTRHDLDRLQISSLPIGQREGDQMTQFERSSINDPESFLPSLVGRERIPGNMDGRAGEHM
jgi:hypothetical protein